MINPFSDLGKETQNPFLDTRIRIWIFPKKRTQSVLTAAMLEEQNNKSYLHENRTVFSNGNDFHCFPPPAWPLRAHSIQFTKFDEFFKKYKKLLKFSSLQSHLIAKKECSSPLLIKLSGYALKILVIS